jgi:geranylgeranyl transferase type-2 subunit beta
LGYPDALPREETIQFVLSCQQPNGGFGAAPGHDAHMLYTVSAVQILATLDALNELSRVGGKDRVGLCMLLKTLDQHVTDSLPVVIANLQNKDTGAFSGDEWGEEDTRFVYGALNAMSLLQLMPMIDVGKAVEYIAACENFDGGFGSNPGAESHAGQIFACLAALAIAERLDLVDKDKLATWLSERQVERGGLNGRPEKLEDVCYSWWVLSSLAILERTHWIDGKKLEMFILKCQVSILRVLVATSLIVTRTPKMVELQIVLGIWLTFSTQCLASPDLVFSSIPGWKLLTLDSESKSLRGIVLR